MRKYARVCTNMQYTKSYKLKEANKCNFIQEYSYTCKSMQKNANYHESTWKVPINSRRVLGKYDNALQKYQEVSGNNWESTGKVVGRSHMGKTRFGA